MKLNYKEAEYFENLVAFNQAMDQEEKKYFFDKISSFKTNRDDKTEKKIYIVN